MSLHSQPPAAESKLEPNEKRSEETNRSYPPESPTLAFSFFSFFFLLAKKFVFNLGKARNSIRYHNTTDVVCTIILLTTIFHDKHHLCYSYKARKRKAWGRIKWYKTKLIQHLLLYLIISQNWYSVTFYKSLYIFLSLDQQPHSQILYLEEYMTLLSYKIWAVNALSFFVLPYFSTGQILLAKEVLMVPHHMHGFLKKTSCTHYVAVTHLEIRINLEQPKTRTCFTHCWLKGTRNKKWPGWSLGFQIVKSMVIFPDGSIWGRHQGLKTQVY